MITKNAYNILTALAITNDVQNIGGGYFIPIRNIAGTTEYASLAVGEWPFTAFNRFRVSTSNMERGISVGSGTTPPTSNDYNLESQISYSVIDGTAELIDRGFDEDGAYAEILLSITNIGSSPLTISEVGLFGRQYMSIEVHGSSGATTAFLVDRTLLDSPVTIPVNGSAEILYRISAPTN